MEVKFFVFWKLYSTKRKQWLELMKQEKLTNMIYIYSRDITIQ